MSKKKMRISSESSNDGPGWLTTFNDLVTLLMVFFVLLFTMGSVNTQAMHEFKNALQSGLGLLGAGSQASIEIKDSQQDLDNEEINSRPMVMAHPWTNSRNPIPSMKPLKRLWPNRASTSVIRIRAPILPSRICCSLISAKRG